MSHVAWLGALFLRWPGFFAGKDLKAFRLHAQQSAIARKKRGSQVHKDLFHHLVNSKTPKVIKGADCLFPRSMKMALRPIHPP